MLIKLAAFLVSLHHYIQDELAESREAVSRHSRQGANKKYFKAVREAHASRRGSMARADRYQVSAEQAGLKRDKAREMYKALTK